MAGAIIYKISLKAEKDENNHNSNMYNAFINRLPK